MFAYMQQASLGVEKIECSQICTPQIPNQIPGAVKEVSLQNPSQCISLNRTGHRFST